MRMRPTLSGSTALKHFEHSNAVETRNGIMFDFYLGLPHATLGFTGFTKCVPTWT